MKIGDQVRITKGLLKGKEFVIKFQDEYTGKAHYSAPRVCWYPEDSLELVEEELKIGDKVEVIGPCIHGYIDRPEDAKRFKISEVVHVNGQTGYRVLNGGEPAYSASSLRKVSKPKLELSDEAKEKIGKAIWKHMDSENDRLGAIEEKLKFSEQCNANICKQLDDMKKLISYQNDTNDRLRKRCHDVEQKISQLEERYQSLRITISSITFMMILCDTDV